MVGLLAQLGGAAQPADAAGAGAEPLPGGVAALDRPLARRHVVDDGAPDAPDADVEME